MTLEELLKKNEPRLRGLHPQVAAATRKLIELAYKEGIYVLIAQGYRSKEEQDELYKIGRTPGDKRKPVTNARGGYSYHNYGLAVDYCLLTPDGKQAIWKVDDKWRRVAQIAKTLGFEWGGDWKSFPDYPHLQMTFGLSIKDLLAGKHPPMPKPAAKTDAKEEEDVKKCVILVDGKKLEGILYQDRSYVPVRALAEALGLQVSWDSKTKTVVLKKEGGQK